MQNSSDTVSGQAGEWFSQPSLGHLPALLSRVQAQADAAFSAYIALCRKDAVLAWELKIERGLFGQTELTAHRTAAEMLGKHRAFQAIADMISELLEKGK